MHTTAFIALGANLRHARHGPPAAVISAAIITLAREPQLNVEAVSRRYCTRAVGPPQPAYVNAVVRVATSLAPAALLALLHAIETDFGRRRHRRWGARVLDLDLISHGRAVIRQPGLIVPHPRMHVRAFVLAPLCDVAGSWRHPQLHRSAPQLLARCGDRGSVRALAAFALQADAPQLTHAIADPPFE